MSMQFMWLIQHTDCCNENDGIEQCPCECPLLRLVGFDPVPTVLLDGFDETLLEFFERDSSLVTPLESLQHPHLICNVPQFIRHLKTNGENYRNSSFVF